MRGLLSSRFLKRASLLSLLVTLGCGGSTLSSNTSDGASGAAGGASATGGGSSSGAAGSGAASSGGAGAPVGCENCVGLCSGNACMGEYTCDTSATCTKNIVQYCGCDGVTFEASGNCPNRPWVSEGPCPTAATKSCDPAEISCQTLVPPAACPDGQVHSVASNCYGPCVPIEECDCSKGQACPDENQYVCWQSAGHCGPYVR